MRKFSSSERYIVICYSLRKIAWVIRRIIIVRDLDPFRMPLLGRVNHQVTLLIENPGENRQYPGGFSFFPLEPLFALGVIPRRLRNRFE